MNGNFVRAVRIDWKKVPEGSYLRSIPALRQCEELKLEAPVTFLVGENGSGKSTLLEAVAVAAGFAAEGGTFNYRFSTYDSHSSLHGALTLVRGPRRPERGFFLRAESFYNVATRSEEYRDQPPEIYYARFGGRSFHDQSHGESFLALVRGGFGPGGLYLLDEPEAALSPQRQLSLLLLLYRLGQQGSQCLIATHSPILLGTPGAQLLQMDETGIRPIRYEEADSVQVTRLFLNDRERMLRTLLEED